MKICNLLQKFYGERPQPKKRLRKKLLNSNTENMNQVINEGTCFEIYCKIRLNLLNKFLGKHTGRAHNDNVTMRVNTVNLPKFEMGQSIQEWTK